MPAIKKPNLNLDDIIRDLEELCKKHRVQLQGACAERIIVRFDSYNLVVCSFNRVDANGVESVFVAGAFKDLYTKPTYPRPEGETEGWYEVEARHRESSADDWDHTTGTFDSISAAKRRVKQVTRTTGKSFEYRIVEVTTTRRPV